MVLARWYAAFDDFESALDHLVRRRARQPALARDPRQSMLEALFLCRLGRAVEARALLAAGTAGSGFDTSVALMRANAWNPAAGAPEPDAEARMLAEINAVFRHYRMAEIGRRDPGQPLSLDNLAAAAPVPRQHASQHGALVTVIVPLWNAEATLATTLASLAAQSHAELEVLVVDDASTDSGPDIAADFAHADPRFRLIRQPVNGGSYAARNRALAEARGEFVTVHDADDWSHPEKIARHLADLTARDVPFNISDWARTTRALCFWGPCRPVPNQTPPRQLMRNFASVFFRRALIERVGPWDTARISADREFINRIQTLHGLRRQIAFLPGAPLAFGRIEDTSLTRAGATSVATMHHGLRREYHEASDLWHAGLDPARVLGAGPDAGIGTEPPYFPAPPALRSVRAAAPGLDLLFIGDFNFKGGTQKSAMHMIAAARQAGLSAGLLHYRRYDQDVSQPLDHDVRRTAWDSGVRIVAPGESLQARTVVVTYPPIFAEAMDRFPQVEHERLVVVVNQMAERDRTGSDVAYDPARVRAHLVELLGSEGLWAPISERVRALMLADARYPAPIGTWTPLIDTATWCARVPVWRGDARARPVIGRHGRDHPLKWPADRAGLRAAYCADRPCEVRFLGGSGHARARAGRWPGNWQSQGFGAQDVRGFLADLDVFLHFPDPDYIEEFGRAPMEAMAVGVPVILPEEFEPTFGAAALYAAPDGVWPLVERLWADRGLWEARVAAGRAFVAASCAYASFPGRLALLPGAAAPAPAAEAAPA
jgi:hypothetical protein